LISLDSQGSEIKSPVIVCSSILQDPPGFLRRSKTIAITMLITTAPQGRPRPNPWCKKDQLASAIRTELVQFAVILGGCEVFSVVKSGREAPVAQSAIPFHKHKSNQMLFTQDTIDFWSGSEICLLDPQGNRQLLTRGKSSLLDSSPRVMPGRIEASLGTIEQR
jgi:hypothetical protein